MTLQDRQPVYLKDYQSSAFEILETHLTIALNEEETRVTSKLVVKTKTTQDKSRNLKLDGEDLELISVQLNNDLLHDDQYIITPHSLEIINVPHEFTLEIQNRIFPQQNTRLSGLYKSSGNFCTQCEAQGFRRITYYLDRPDVLSTFFTTITADKSIYPFLLSNGNLIETRSLENNRHLVRWHDPFKKPSYLFALVAGDLALLEDYFTTRSGKNVTLQIYVEKENIDKCDYAMQALKKAMRWDEERFNREYDLERYMIVAVNDFNMGAMENKGLNLFNSKYVLVSPTTATDRDYLLVDAVIGHEYFHNWSGNRVTCRDWFQLSLKEGLTIFREHEFCSDLTSHHVKRIEDVRSLRSEQFPQDSGPMAHPVRPDCYLEINNFYTVTIYEKGAEVIRMIQTLVGKDGFDQGLDLYFTRHDGQAVTIEEFVKAMEDANQKDLTQFRLWYTQAGTPELVVTTKYSAEEKNLAIHLHQSCLPTPGQAVKKPLHLPVVVGLLDYEGKLLTFNLENGKEVHETTLELTKVEQIFYLENVTKQPIPSLLRGFSAPVKLTYNYTDDELSTLTLYDTDGFNRWEARQVLCLRVVRLLIKQFNQQEKLTLNKRFIEDFQTLLEKNNEDKLLTSELLAFPSQKYIAEFMDIIDIDAIFHVREFIMKEIAQHLKAQLLDYYTDNIEKNQKYGVSVEAIATRTLKNTCLHYLSKLEDKAVLQLLDQQFNDTNNMTDRSQALLNLSHIDCLERTQALEYFYQQYQDDALVLDKWFAIQAMSTLPSALTDIRALLKHPAYTWKNPNRVRSVLASFAMQNPYRFHDLSGEGYQLLTDSILYLDSLNPQLAARLTEPLTQWRRHTPARQELIKAQLQRIFDKKDLSSDTYELVSKSLN